MGHSRKVKLLKSYIVTTEYVGGAKVVRAILTL
jgi:hypothetical protein